MTNTRVKGIINPTTPYVCTDDNAYFKVGDPVRIEDNSSMSHMTVGTIQDIIYRGEETIPLVLVHWLEGAPPIRILMTKLIRMKPMKFWMVAGDVGGDFVREDSADNIRNGSISPAKKFATEAEAVVVASRMKTRYRRNYILLEAVKYVTMDSDTVNTL
ncbi:MAG: hypothetical protein ACRC0G_14500 [Fusobacteriaceae bacterium]